MFRIVLVVLMFVSLILITCHNQCKPTMARCTSTGVVQLCQPNDRWSEVVSCKKVGNWNCVCTDPKTCRCKKPER